MGDAASSREATLSIGDEEYVLADLTVGTQRQVGRIARLRDEIEELQMQIQERQIVLKAYSDAIVQAVKPVDTKAKVN
jgi:hypothetical protein|tara:strand:- start:681 stop:914 length:234 start_codon:yes stop_codon:yes gene_type:complete